MLDLLQSWLAEAQALAGRVPEIAAAAGSWSWAAAAGAALVGLALLLAGVRLGPLLTGVGGALIGWWAGIHVATMAQIETVPVSTIGWAAAASLGVLSVFAPPVYPALLGAVPGALLGLRVPLGGRAWLGAAVVAALLAGSALFLRRIVVAATAAIAGAVLLVGAVVALAASVPAVAAVAHRPVLLVGVGALLAVASTAYQAAMQGRVEPRGRPLGRG